MLSNQENEPLAWFEKKIKKLEQDLMIAYAVQFVLGNELYAFQEKFGVDSALTDEPLNDPDCKAMEAVITRIKQSREKPGE